MAELKNEFTWSYSRNGLFEECRRKYWLNYYGWWGGWDRESPPRARQLYIQKKLTSRAMWLGTVVHDTAEAALKDLMRRRKPTEQGLLELASRRAKRDLDESRRKRFLEWPGKAAGFQEHYYETADADEGWDEVIDEIARQVRNLVAHPVFRRMVSVPERIVEVEELVQVPIDGVPVWVKLDALMDDGEGGLVIVDWKTGKGHLDDEIGRQLGIYGEYARQAHGRDPDKLRAMHVNLRSGEYKTHPVDAEQLELSRGFVRDSADRMRALLSDVAGNVAREEDFPKLPEGEARCGWCRFRRDCDREEAKSKG